MTLWSKYFLPTLKESPAEAEIASHRLLIRAGLVRKLGGGLYTYLPLGLRVMQKISRMCRQALDEAGAIELAMPLVHPAELWEQGPRWSVAREIMFRVDGAGAQQPAAGAPQFVLGPTHEEVVTPLVGASISSYRDLPKTFYQIGPKFRNEIRPRYGLMRAREFVMMDAYSFDVSDEAAVGSYMRMKAAYEHFFRSIELTAISVEADTGVMGGSFSHEFMVPAEVGDDDIIFGATSGYAANREKATSALVPADFVDIASDGSVERFPTPGVTTIAELSAPPYGVPAERQFKTLVYIGDGRPFVVILRGCDELEEAKLGALGFAAVRPAEPQEIEEVMGARPGSLGAVRDTIRKPGALAGIYADKAIRLIGNGVTGANEDGYHLRHVNVQRDLAVGTFGDFRRVCPGEPDPLNGAPLQVKRGIEVGHTFKLGTKYSDKFGTLFMDDQKQSHPMVMGCYGIGISRTMQAVVEQHHDGDGIIWPWPIAPFQVVVVVLDPQLTDAMDLARTLAASAEPAGADVLIDDRVERPGVKFKDADLIGIPLRVTIGGKGLREGIVEFKLRYSKDVERVPISDAASRLADVVRRAAAAS